MNCEINKMLYANQLVYLDEEWHTLWFLDEIVTRNCKTSLMYYDLALWRFVTTAAPCLRYSKLPLLDWFCRVSDVGLYEFPDRLFPKPVRHLWNYRSYSRSALSILAVQSLSLQRGGDGLCDRRGWSPKVEDGRSVFEDENGRSVFEDECRWSAFVHRVNDCWVSVPLKYAIMSGRIKLLESLKIHSISLFSLHRSLSLFISPQNWNWYLGLSELALFNKMI